MTTASLRRLAWLLLIGWPVLASCAEGAPPPVVSARRVAPEPSNVIELAPDLHLREIGDGAHVIAHRFGFLGNSALVEMPDGTFVFAGTPNTAEATQRVLEWIRRRHGVRRLVAINTGYHLDNLGGNRALLDAGADVHGSDLTVALLRERGEAMRQLTLKLIGGERSEAHSSFATMEFVPPNRVFPIEQGLTLVIGGEVIRVLHAGPTQAPDKVAVYFPERGLLFGGCMLVGGERLGNLTEANLAQWLDTARKLAELPVAVAVPGHSERLDPGVITNTIRLLETALSR